MPTPAMTAFSDDFFVAFSNIEGDKQGKVVDFLTRFRKTPSFAHREYHHIPDALDPCFYITPVAKTGYHFVVFKPEDEEFYALLWIDHEDAACDWGKNRTCLICSETKTVSIILKKEAGLPTEDGFFSSCTKEQLFDLGVPEQSIGNVYSVSNTEGLEGLKAFVPMLTFECLFLLHSGDSYEDVLEVYHTCLQEEEEEEEEKEKTEKKRKRVIEKETKQDDKEPVILSYCFNNSQEKFLVNPGQEELLAALEEPLAKWRIFLHRSQRKLINKDWNGPVRVFGGAGTGKTVVALHRAVYLARKNPNAKILFTVFSKTLVVDLQRQLHSLCLVGEDKNIEVINIDAWVKQFLKKEGINLQMNFANGQEEAFWQEAMSLLPDDSIDEDLQTKKFFKEEWEQVIEWHGITTKEEYLVVPRRGRKIKLTRAERVQLWPVFEKFRSLLDEYGITPFGDAARKAREIIEKRIEEGEKYLYSFVIVDECQDMTEQDIRLIRALVPSGRNDIFLVGDPYQRIYGYPVPFSRWGISIVGRSRKMWLNYRTTEQIRREALSFVPEDLGGEDKIDGRNVSVTFGPEAKRKKFKSSTAAIEAIVDEISDLELKNERLKLSEVCVVSRYQNILDSDVVRLAFENRELKTHSLAAVADNAIEGVRLATMHRIKGLEFNHVFIIESQKNIDSLDKDNEEYLKENLLRYVAASRAKMTLHIYSY